MYDYLQYNVNVYQLNAANCICIIIIAHIFRYLPMIS